MDASGDSIGFHIGDVTDLIEWSVSSFPEKKNQNTLAIQDPHSCRYAHHLPMAHLTSQLSEGLPLRSSWNRSCWIYGIVFIDVPFLPGMGMRQRTRGETMRSDCETGCAFVTSSYVSWHDEDSIHCVLLLESEWY